MSVLKVEVEVAENGFVVYEESCIPGARGKTWAFEKAASLSKFMLEWGKENTKIQFNPEKATDK